MTLNSIFILIADDNIDDRLSLRATLEAKGYFVSEAADSDEAYAKALSDLPDLIILDVGMPPEDGYAVCRRIRSNDETLRVPILMLTCHGLVEERTTGLYAGADDYVIKPCHNDELLARISALLRRFPPKSNFFERIEQAQLSIEAAEAYRQNIVVMNIDVKDSSKPPSNATQEYTSKLIFRDYHTIVEDTISSLNGSKVAWAGDGGTSEFRSPKSAVSAALLILERVAHHPRVRDLILRVGIAGGLELLDPSCDIGKRTSHTHNRAGHYQKQSNHRKVTIGAEIYESLSLSDKARFQECRQSDDEITYESK